MKENSKIPHRLSVIYFKKRGKLLEEKNLQRICVKVSLLRTAENIFNVEPLTRQIQYLVTQMNWNQHAVQWMDSVETKTTVTHT